MKDPMETVELSPKELGRIPAKTGCYIFKGFFGADDEEKVIYVGKAKNLRSRVRSYFSKEGDGRAFFSLIKEKTKSIQYILVHNDQDALILENELIKRYKPTFNIHLKDDKRYLSLRLDIEHEWPRIEIVRRVQKDKAVYLGPFSSSRRLRETLNTLQKIFPLRSCPDSKLYNRVRPCIEYDIKRCVAPCVDYVSRPTYQELVESTVQFLKGRSDELLEELERKMDKAAGAENYEEAARLRDQIAAIRDITQTEGGIVSYTRSLVDRDLDAISIVTEGDRALVYVLFIRNAVVWDGQSFEFSRLKMDELELLEQFITRYYSEGRYLPHEVLVDKNLEILGLPEELRLVCPRSKEKISFLRMSQENARAQMEERTQQRERISKVIDSLQQKLSLSKRPSRMDCIDISHHHGSDVVASVVRFADGIPQKSFYRKIRLKTQKMDDFESMREAVARRYKEEDELPDLIVVDGGKGQLSSALEALKQLPFELSCEVVSLAKAKDAQDVVDPLNPKNRERVFKPGRSNPILLTEGSAEELLLSYLRDEAHRFAITYHRKKKNEGVTASALDQVKGLGSRQKIKLLKHFGSIERIQAASDSELLTFLNKKALEQLRKSLSVVE